MSRKIRVLYDSLHVPHYTTMLLLLSTASFVRFLRDRAMMSFDSYYTVFYSRVVHCISIHPLDQATVTVMIM
jgi:hypothetical protein